MSQEDGTVRSVLIIDDDLGFAESLADILQSRGYAADYFDTPERALAVLRDPPDGSTPAPVALIDVRLGGSESGVDLIPRLRAEHPELLCVLMTTGIDSQTAIAALRLRAFDYFDKSWDPNSLFAVLDRCFDRIALLRDRAAYEALRLTKEKAMVLQIAHAAQHDALTGLPNRVLLNDRVGRAIGFASRHGNKVAVLFLDLDGFKHINDSLGHPIGDQLLQSIGGRLLDCVRGSDTVSRQGGDEFVVLLSDVQHLEDVAILATRMLRTVAERHFIDRRDLHITTSIGVSVYPEDGLDAETLIKNADTAMYQAKENGRQCYRFFTPAMNVRAVERQSIEADLRRALERRELELHYQPKIDLTTGEITGAEALLRWTHPARGLIAPAEFIPVAEDCGLIMPIGNWALRQACEQARAWVDAGLAATTMAVNVSAIEFRDKNFLKNLFVILDDTDLDPRWLELELTESVLVKNAESAASILQTLRQRGVQVAIDDFGTGYSSLGYLRKFPLDALKIDQSFVRQISNHGEDTAIVTAVIAMARSLKLRVIAEGVETLQELEFLQANEM